jgi:hypothetical protein
MRARASFLSSINQNHPTLCLVSLNDGTAWTNSSETMGLPAQQAEMTYWFPWYNNVDLNSQLRFANISASPATVTVTIAGVAQPSIPLAVGYAFVLTNLPAEQWTAQDILSIYRFR